MTAELRGRLQAMNPEPNGDPSPDELAAVFALIEARRSSMSTEDARSERQTNLAASPPRTRRRPAIVFAGMALLILLLVGGTALVFRSSDEPPADSTPTTMSPPTTGVSPTVAAPLLPVVDSWQQVGTDVMAAPISLMDITMTSTGLLAVGFSPGTDNLVDGVILTSEDGVAWTRVSADDPALTQGQVLLYSVVEGEPGLIAAGVSNEPTDPRAAVYPTVWTSTDGTAWTRMRTDVGGSTATGAILDVIAVDAGLVAAGNIDERGPDGTIGARPVAWFSPDGVSWSRVFEGEWIDVVGEGLPGFEALERAPSGVIVGTGGAENESGEAVPAVWTSQDGTSWERVEHADDVFAPGTGMADLAWGSAGFVAVGSDGGAATAVWRSPDGHSWSRVPTADQPLDISGSLMIAIAALDDGYVGLGPPHWFEGDDLGSWATLWTSPDGLTWDPVHILGEGFAEAVVATESGLVVVGSSVWMGPGLDPSAPPPPPTSTAETTTTTPPPGLNAADLVTVERVAEEYLTTVLDGGRIWDVALGGPGLVAVGEVTTPDDEYLGGPSRDAFIIVSNDGRTWERVEDLPDSLIGDDWQQLERVWGSATGVIAQGLGSWYASGNGTAWAPITDEDLYDAWERNDGQGELWYEFLEGGPGWVAVLYRDSETGPNACYFVYESRSCENPELQEVLISGDGFDWEPTTETVDDLIEPPAEAPTPPGSNEWNSGDSFYPWNLAWSQEQVVAVRYHDAMTGISPDGGQTWLRVDPEQFAGDGAASYVPVGGESGIWTIDVIRFSDLYVIVGDAYNAAGVWILEWNDVEEES